MKYCNRETIPYSTRAISRKHKYHLHAMFLPLAVMKPYTETLIMLGSEQVDGGRDGRRRRVGGNEVCGGDKGREASL